ncbi:MAG: hypothetical protein IKO93_09980 [Lentisphaeria bacterium]|nr:hypothetical protein [Lentisphaeria bacterium]
MGGPQSEAEGSGRLSRSKPMDEKYRWGKIKWRNKDVEYRGGKRLPRILP